MNLLIIKNKKEKMKTQISLMLLAAIAFAEEDVGAKIQDQADDLVA